MAYSAGFTPHPKVSYANAAPTGTASEAEYLEIALTESRDPERLRLLLDESLPTGLDVIEAVEARTPHLAERLEASRWELRLDGVPVEEARRAVTAFLAADTVEVRRQTKKGMRAFDARGAVVSLEALPAETADTAADTVTGGAAHREPAAPGGSDGGPGRPCAILRLVVRHDTPAVRPDDVLSGLRAVADLAPPVPAAVTRLAQGPLDEGTGSVGDPLAPDRDAAAATPSGAAGRQAAAVPETTG
ncbi:TIGR03936 family radical SAM-associated protein [Streptomyces calidiresistens]